jgi:hypothetical protein
MPPISWRPLPTKAGVPRQPKSRKRSDSRPRWTRQSAFQKLAGKQFDVMEQVIDQSYSSVMRQIVYYTYVRDAGFLHFRFNFKRTGTGLVLANFAFKDETNELFPKDFRIGNDEQGR